MIVKSKTKFLLIGLSFLRSIYNWPKGLAISFSLPVGWIIYSKRNISREKILNNQINIIRY